MRVESAKFANLDTKFVAMVTLLERSPDKQMLNEPINQSINQALQYVYQT